MTAIFILLTFSLIVSMGFLAAFIWAVKSGQFDDDYTPSIRMLFDNKIKNNNDKNSKHEEKA